MLILDFVRYLKGTVRFEVSGGFAERFVNLAARERIPVWDCKRRDGRLTASTNVKSYKRLRSVAKKAGARIRIREKAGVPFQKRRFQKRWGLYLGLGLFMAFLFAMSLFIWQVDVRGLETLPESRVLSALEEIGLRAGSFRSGLDVRDCERRTLLKVPELSWIAINIDGSTATIEVSERSLPPAPIDSKTPCNLVAAKTGQIVKMNVYEGQAMVGIGDAVLRGDLLVSGITQDKLGKNLFRHARAEVFARIEHRTGFEVPLDQVRYVETGEVIERGYLDLFGISVPLFLPLRIEGFYRVQETEETALFGLDSVLKIHGRQYVMMREESVRLTEPQAKELAMRELRAIETVELGGAEILERRLEASVANGKYILSADYVCIMDICEAHEILVSAGE